MKKKLSAYLSLFVMLSSFLTGPISVYAETINPEEKTTQTTDSQKENQETDVTNEDNKNGEEVQQSESSTTTTTEEPTKVPTEESTIKETTQSTEKQPRAPTRKKRATQDSVITSFSITDDKGNPLNNSVSQWTKFRINGTFELPNNLVAGGDTTTIKIPDQIKFGDTQSFDLNDAVGSVVAHAVIDPDSKTIVLTYTDYVETHSNVKGSFFFYGQVDTTVVKENQTIPIKITIEKEVVIDAGNIEYEVDTPVGDELSKSGWFEDGSDQDAKFFIPINRGGKDLPSAVLNDSLSIPGARIVQDSIKIEQGRWVLNDSNTDWVLEDSKDVTNDYNVSLNGDGNELSVDLGNISSSEGFAVHYKVHLDYKAVDGEKITNNASLKSEETIVKEVTSDAVYYQGGGNGGGAVFSIRIHKSNEDGENLAGAEFEVIRDRNQQSFGTLVTDSSGNTSVGNLLKDSYTIKETKAPDGYELSNDEIKITPEDFGDNKEAFKEIVNKKSTPETTQVNGEKIWQDNDNQDGKRPEAITVNLLADGQQVDSKEVKEADGWTYAFTNLPKFKDGKEIVYTVTENQVSDYNTEIKGFDITNSYTPGKTSVSVTKKWEDINNQDGKRPNSIQVQLLANGEKHGEAVALNEANKWTTTWTDLDQKANGKDIVYTVEEVRVPGYTTTIDDTDKGNILLTNTYTPEVTEVKGAKTWNDNDNQDGKRPEAITVNLLADGQQVDSKEVKEADGWTYAFTNLPKFKDGKEIVYTVTENQVSDYNTEIKGFDITNSYTPGKTSVSVTKKWEDINNQDGKRPNSIQVQLLANGEKHGEAVALNEANKWTTTWTDLDQKANGKDIVYTVEEVRVPGYTTTIDDTDKGNILLTNTYTPEVTEVKGAKTWNDNDNQDGKRPEAITVNLLADGQQVDSKEVKEADGWTYAFTNLPKFKDGKEIVYTVTENQVSDYNTEIKGFDITNSYTPGKTSVSVTKKWEDINNQDGKRPNSIQVQLLANGEKHGEAVALNEANKWTTTWTDLDQKANGKDIVYTVEEVRVPGYTTTIDDTDKGNILLTNTYTPEVTEVKGAKTWNDNDNQDGKRPEAITVNLLADGQQVDSKEVKEADGWTYAFTNLPKFKDGKEIVYTVTENQVSDYNTEIKGFDITNSYTPGKTSVSVTKKWEDINNQDGKRPNSIQVQLLANGEKHGEAVALNEANKWTTTWTDLDQKANGKDIVYTVEEVRVPGYTTTIDDTDKGNILLTNTYTPEVTEVKGAKTWNDNDNQDGKRPEAITVNLLADGQQVDSKEVKEADGWTYAFTNLPKFKDGKEIVYTVTENQVSDYNTEIKGFDITNSYTPGKTSVSVTKKWEDINNQDGKRPNSIQVQLLANGEKHGEAVALNEANKWTTTWTDLDQKANGKDIVYTVEEVRVPGYTTTIDDTDKGNILLTNTYTPEVTEVKGAKTWNDNDNQDGKRPEAITVNLLADGQQVDSKEVKEADGWTYAFTNLPKFKDGKEIVYTVTENQVSDYNTEIKGFDITNTYSPGEISGTVTKHWEDGNNQDGIRPENIKIQLYANGEKQGKPVEVKAKDNWTYTWQHLKLTDENGKVIQYSIKEVDVVEGYTATVTGENTGNLLITNTHTPTTPDKPDKPSKPSTPGKHLPQTGEQKMIWLSVVGLILILAIGGYYFYTKKKVNK